MTFCSKCGRRLKAREKVGSLCAKCGVERYNELMQRSHTNQNKNNMEDIETKEETPEEETEEE